VRLLQRFKIFILVVKIFVKRATDSDFDILSVGEGAIIDYVHFLDLSLFYAVEILTQKKDN
jgi:hypothetical protein